MLTVSAPGEGPQQDLIYQDELTGIQNRRAFSTRLQEAMTRAAAEKAPLSLAVVDLDFFKSINDTYGHLDGDQVLTAFGHILREVCNGSSMPFRYGGDEFTVLLPGTARTEACRLMEELAERVRETPFKLRNGQDHQLTLSIGVAGYPDDVEALDELFDAADRAVYLSKRRGRNQVSWPDSGQRILFDAQNFHRLFPCPRLIGRGDLMSSIRPHLMPTAAGRRPIIVVEGYSGVGKSRILEECRHLVDSQRFHMLNGRAQPHLVNQPFGLIVEALRPFLRSEANVADAICKQLSPEERIAVSTLLPHLVPDGGVPDIPPAARRQLITRGLVKLLIALSTDKPLALFLDDVQWSEAGALDVLKQLKESPEGRSAVVMMTLRKESGEENKTLLDFLVSAVRSRLVLMLEVEPLTYHMVQEMISSIVPGAENNAQLVHIVTQKSKALPLLVEEMLKLLIQAGFITNEDGQVKVKSFAETDVPTSVDEIVLIRRQTLDMEVQSSIDKAAVIGAAFDVDVLKEVEGKQSGEVLDAIDKGVRASLLRPDGVDEFSFTSHQVQTGLYKKVSKKQRTEIHNKVAEFEEARNQDAPDAVLSQVAFHQQMAGNHQQAQATLARLEDYQQPRTPFTPYGTNAKRIDTSYVQQISGDIEILLRDLESGNVEKIAFAMQALVDEGESVSEALVRFLMLTDDIRARRIAMKCLSEVSKQILSPILEELHRSQDYQEKVRLIHCLGELKNAKVAELLEAFASFPNQDVRRAALAVLERMKTDSSYAIIFEAAKSTDPAVQQDAVACLGRMGRLTPVPDLLALIKPHTIFFHERKTDVQREACIALGRLQDNRAIGPLIAVLRMAPWWTLMQTKKPEVRAAAAIALAGFSGPAIDAALKAAIHDPNLQVRSAAKLALNRLRGQVLVEELEGEALASLADANAEESQA
ncbi:MAG: diguanylate cyclase [Candidatus Xenobia bacterium]